MTDTQGHSGPGLAEKSVTMYGDNKLYANALASGIRHIESYSPKDLEAKGIVKGGKVNAEGIWNYINSHVAKPLLGKRNFDSNDPGYLANFAAIRAAVEQYGKKGITPDLLERLVATYQSTSSQYIGQRDVQMAGALPTDEGKAAVRVLAKITGQDITLGPWIDGATDPTEVANRKGAVERQLQQIVEEAVATGSLDKIIEQSKAGAHAPH